MKIINILPTIVSVLFFKFKHTIKVDFSSENPLLSALTLTFQHARSGHLSTPVEYKIYNK